MSDTLKLALTTPVVTRFPGAFSPWEAAAGPEELIRIAVAADTLGFDHLSCAEHVAVPVEVAEERGGTYWDPLATLAFLAARTTRVRLLTKVLVAGYHHPLAVAKRYGTLDRLSGGRVVLGVGVGSLREEFELLGAEFEGRGARAEEWLTALRTALGVERPEHAGPHYPFRGMVVDPTAVQDEVPIWVGGRTLLSLRRATRLAQGWAPFALSNDAVAAMLAEVERPDGFEVVLSTPPLDPSAEPERAREEIAELHEAGATLVSVALRAQSCEHYLEQMEAVVALGARTLQAG